MTELDGTELFTRITERLTDEAMSERIAKAMAVFVDTVNMTVTQQKEKVFVIPDNIEEAAILIYLQMSVQREQKKPGMMWNFFL